MLETVFACIFVGLVLLGVLAVSYGIMFRLLMPKGRYDYYILIPSDLCNENITQAAYSARTKLNLIGDENYGKVVVVDTGMDESQRLSCLNVCRQTNGIYLITSNELEDLFNER